MLDGVQCDTWHMCAYLQCWKEHWLPSVRLNRPQRSTAPELEQSKGVREGELGEAWSFCQWAILCGGGHRSSHENGGLQRGNTYTGDHSSTASECLIAGV